MRTIELLEWLLSSQRRKCLDIPSPLDQAAANPVDLMLANVSKILKSQSFTLGLVLSVVAALCWPELGVHGGPLRTESTSKLAVAVIFLIQGLSLPTRQILASASKFRLHAFCQGTNFILAPLLMLGFLFVFDSLIHNSMKAGFFYLAALPCTISSAIVMTSNSDGDSSAALFSTTLSNILGVFITPLLCSHFIAHTSDQETSLISMIGKISLLILLPIVAGQLIRPFVREWAIASKNTFKRVSNTLILFIVFASFSQSVHNGVWQAAGPRLVLDTLLFSSLFMLIFSIVVWYLSPLAVSSTPDRIAAFFCGSHKTLAAGVPMASILFSNLLPGGITNLGFILLPLLCYHPLQLILAGILSPYFARLAKNS